MADFSVSSVSTLQTQLAILCNQLQIQNSYFNNKLDNVENRLYQAESKIPVNGNVEKPRKKRNVYQEKKNGREKLPLI